VAVVFVRPERVTERQLELFAREARAGGRLHHPGIVTVHGFGTSDGLAWIAMEFVGGAWTLKDFLDDVARAAEVPEGYDRHVANLVAEIADAMQAAHEAGVIHRDLKPQNVLVTSEDHPKVTDFGLARITDESALSATGDFAGTYFYMSPEQVAAKRAGIDHRTDVFSLGVVLYELLALRRPFEGDTSHQVAAQILAKDPPDIRTIRSRVPRDLAVIAGKALEKDRDRRFQSMQELAADLRRHLADEPIHARPPTRLERVVKWAKRNPGKSSAAAILAVTFTAIALLLFANVRANRALSAKTIESEERRVIAEQSAERERATADLAKANAERATEEKERADRETEAATRKADEVLRLSALQELDDLVAEADRLWPAVPENLPKYEEWLKRAHELIAELPDQTRKDGSASQGAPCRRMPPRSRRALTSVLQAASPGAVHIDAARRHGARRISTKGCPASNWAHPASQLRSTISLRSALRTFPTVSHRILGGGPKRSRRRTKSASLVTIRTPALRAAWKMRSSLASASPSSWTCRTSSVKRSRSASAKAGGSWASIQTVTAWRHAAIVG
jgi:hypothetical protein